MKKKKAKETPPRRVPFKNNKGHVVELDERLTVGDLAKMGITLKVGTMRPLPDGWYEHPI